MGWLFRNGKINEREARTHPRRNLLQKALGAGHQFVDPQVGAVAYEPGDRFLLCTDGLVDGLYDEQLLEHLRVAAEQACGRGGRCGRREGTGGIGRERPSGAVGGSGAGGVWAG